MSSFMSWVRISIAGLAMVVLSCIFIVLMIPLLPWRLVRIYCCNGYGTVAGLLMSWACKAEIIFHHRSRTNEHKPAIFVSNHTSSQNITYIYNPFNFISILDCDNISFNLCEKRIHKSLLDIY